MQQFEAFHRKMGCLILAFYAASDSVKLIPVKGFITLSFGAFSCLIKIQNSYVPLVT